jgi:hypothetical protein
VKESLEMPSSASTLREKPFETMDDVRQVLVGREKVDRETPGETGLEGLNVIGFGAKKKVTFISSGMMGLG